MAVFRVEKSKNYTIMSNYHLKDKRLSLKAKGLLSQILSLPENWDYTLAGLSFINSEKIDAIRKAINELESYGYILRSRDRNEKGQLTGAIYTIHEEPQEETPIDRESLPTLENPTLDNPILEKPTLENPPQLNTYYNKINNNKRTDIINPSINHSEAAEKSSDGIDEIDSQQQIDDYRELIHENIEYDVMIANNPNDKGYVDEIVEIMLECVTTQGYVKIGGQKVSAEVVKSRMLKLNYSHIEYILDCMRNNATKVRNIKAYLTKTIYSSPTTMNAYYQAEYNHDFNVSSYRKKAYPNT